MRKADIDHLLETAVARALGVKPPVNRRMRRVTRRAAPARHQGKRAA